VIELDYYAGCTLKTKAKNYESAAYASLEALDVSLVELPRWNCCGAVYSLTADDLAHQLAPVRNLIRARERGSDELVTLCSFCYNTLKRANLLMEQDEEKRHALNSFMEEEPDYQGEVLRDDIGWERISERVQTPLSGLKVAAYYGCTLLRPQEAAIDDVERPTVLQDLLRALGASVVEFPFATECCGSYQIVANPGFVEECVQNILSSAAREGAEALVLSCPLCDFNLGQRQCELVAKQTGFQEMPLFYFTQLMAVALGCDSQASRFELNYGRPESLLKSKGLLS
jgi:heterodisulfide reductase subunit B